MPIIAPTNSFLTVLNRPHFYVGSILCFLSTWGIGFGAIYFSMKDSQEQWVIFDLEQTIYSIGITVVLAGILTFGCGAIRTRVIFGYNPPLRASSYKSNWFKRIVFFSLGIPSTWKRLLVFILNCLLVPAGIITAILAGSCAALKESRSASRTGADCRIDNVYGYAAFSAAARAVLLLAIATMNYLAAHNENQKEFEGIPRQADLAHESGSEDEQESAGASRSHRVTVAIPIEMVAPHEHVRTDDQRYSPQQTEGQVVDGSEAAKEPPFAGQAAQYVDPNAEFDDNNVANEMQFVRETFSPKNSDQY